MSKRSCPFDDNCAPQLKVHVSTDDINQQDENYMKQNQARTVARLFQGSNSIDKSAKNTKPQRQVETRICPECRKCAEIVARCWFCELSLCQSCIRICARCCEHFCSRCSVAIYKYGNNYTCLTCYN